MSTKRYALIRNGRKVAYSSNRESLEEMARDNGGKVVEHVPEAWS